MSTTRGYDSDRLFTNNMLEQDEMNSRRRVNNVGVGRLLAIAISVDLGAHALEKAFHFRYPWASTSRDAKSPGSRNNASMCKGHWR